MRQKKNEPAVKLTSEQLRSLVDAIKGSNLSAESQALLLTVLNAFTQIQQLLASKRLGLLTLLRKIFGLKTERHKSSDSEKTPPTNNPDDKKKPRW